MRHPLWHRHRAYTRADVLCNGQCGLGGESTAMQTSAASWRWTRRGRASERPTRAWKTGCGVVCGARHQEATPGPPSCHSSSRHAASTCPVQATGLSNTLHSAFTLWRPGGRRTTPLLCTVHIDVIWSVRLACASASLCFGHSAAMDAEGRGPSRGEGRCLNPCSGSPLASSVGSWAASERERRWSPCRTGRNPLHSPFLWSSSLLLPRGALHTMCS